ncbi:MAG TPA: bifunctional phosphopantothenoylcysteine decarboxylase/phosphopantothenate--cysteine ligase CoaBC [Candidatus Hungatella pullicola]|nr:bifunctional phosphopantothenoylcysteine decarboxylase/phosphopantothenate--cysteine ligase CoaBC [Candidatus Hungatella pullicola]
MMKGKIVLLGVTGSIAAYKIASLASMLVKRGCQVHVLMTQNATNFINPITFETLTGNKCLVDTFDRNFQFQVEHVSIAKQADVVLIAPASANVIAKLAYGLADDMLTTTVLACRCKKLIAPAMNTAMYENPIVQNNLKICQSYGMEVIAPAVGYLACKDIGVGKMPEPEVLFDYIEREIGGKKDLAGRKILVTAGPTREAIDPVRYITNHSTGKMGYAVAKAASLRGAEVTLVTGITNIPKPRFAKVIEVESARDMFEAVTGESQDQDVIIKAAAVADYRPKDVSSEKMKKQDGDMSMELERTDDILAWLGAHRNPGQFLCGFSMETENMLENSRKKLDKKGIDMVVANNLKVEGAGFGTDTNVVTFITREKEISLEKKTKEEIADLLLDEILGNLDFNRE